MVVFGEPPDLPSPGLNDSAHACATEGMFAKAGEVAPRNDPKKVVDLRNMAIGHVEQERCYSERAGG